MNGRLAINWIIGIIFSLLFTHVNAQSYSYPFEVDNYSFINYSQNRFKLFGDSTAYNNLFAKLDEIILYGNNQMNIVHIGGSHIQADIYTHRIREKFQHLCPGAINAGRGFVFPFDIARTNNPTNYSVGYSGVWDYCKNVKKTPGCELGLSGISVTTTDTSSSVQIGLNNRHSSYSYNKVKIFHDLSDQSFDIEVKYPKISYCIGTNKREGYSLLLFDDYADSLNISFSSRDSSQTYFTLHGFSFETEDAGVYYHAIGVNGAKLNSYLRCEYFENHLKALNPDWVIISIGTNDAYTRRFDQDFYYLSYDSLINLIKNQLPNAAIMLTVPNDSYLYRRYVNKNTEIVKEQIYKLAEKHNAGVWDFYSIMGGLNSIYTWYAYRLAKYDKVHFTRQGYLLKGDLFFNAFLKSYDDHINSGHPLQNQQIKSNADLTNGIH